MKAKSFQSQTHRELKGGGLSEVGFKGGQKGAVFVCPEVGCRGSVSWVEVYSPDLQPPLDILHLSDFCWAEEENRLQTRRLLWMHRFEHMASMSGHHQNQIFTVSIYAVKKVLYAVKQSTCRALRGKEPSQAFYFLQRTKALLWLLANFFISWAA